MAKLQLSPFSSALAAFAILLSCTGVPAQQTTWTFAVSGDSRNCGDFVMPAIAAKVKAEHDAFYWHLGDFRWISHPDQDLLVQDLLTRLEPDRRTAFVLTQMIGLSYHEAAQVCDCPTGTIRSRVARARADLIHAVNPPEQRPRPGPQGHTETA